MSDSISTLALRVDSQSAINNLNKFGVAATALGGTADALRGKIVQLGAAFLSVNFAKRLVAEAAEGQEAFGKYTQVLGRYKDRADKLVTELRNSFNFDATTAQQSIATMTDLFTKSGVELKQAFEFTSDLQKRAADIEAFTNAEGGIASVTQSLTSGMLGNQIALKKLGIVINESALKAQIAEDKTNGLTFATERAAKMHARYALIMKQSASAAGQVSRESDNFSNKLRKLRAISADVRNELGDIIIPVATKLVTSFDKVIRAFEGTSDSVKTFTVVGGAALGTTMMFLPWILKLAVGIKQLRSVTDKGTAAQNLNTEATVEGTVAKEAETTARYANVAAIKAENAALRSQSGGNLVSTITNDAKLGSGAKGAVTSLGPIKRLNSVLGKTFTTIASKIPLLTRFSGAFGKLLGAFGTAGAIIGGVVLSLQALKHAPQMLEKFLDGIGPKIAEFAVNIPDYLWSGIKSGFALGKKGVEAAGKLVVDAMVGGAQFGKRLVGLQTEASRAYRLNKQIEEINKKRAELIATQQKQVAAENAILQARQAAEQSRIDAELKINASKESESVKLAKATEARNKKETEIRGKEAELAQWSAKLASKGITNEERDDAIERSKTLTEEIDSGYEELVKLTEEVDKLADSAHNAAKTFEADQKAFAKTQEDSAKDFADAQNRIALESANTRNGRRALLEASAQRAAKDFEAASSASSEANALNDQIKTIQSQLESQAVATALRDLETLLQEGDWLSDEARLKFAGATVRLEKAGYSLGGNDVFSKQGAQNLLTQLTAERKTQAETRDDLIQERDEKQALAGELGSRAEARAAADKALSDEEKAYREALAEEARNEAERQRQKARSDASFQRELGNTYFARQLSAVDQYFGENKLGASQTRYNLVGQRGYADWNDSLSALYGQQTKIDALSAKLSVLNEKNDNGTLTDDESKEREILRRQLETLQSEFESDYQSAIQRRLSTEDELLGLETTIRSEYLSEAQKFVDEQGAVWQEQMTAQAQAAEEAQRRRLEERSKVEEEARMAVAGIRAITSGSSEAFQIASRIYDRGREELPTEKKIENSTKQIETTVKAMQEQMMNYFREQAGGLTLSMGY